MLGAFSLRCNACCSTRSLSCRRPRDVGRIRLSPIMCMSALCVASLRAGGTGFRWTRARLAARGRLAESSLGSPPRYHWQARRRAASGCADRALLDDSDVVAESPGLRRSSAQSSASPLLSRPASPSPGGSFSAPRSSSLRSRLLRADSALARAALGVNACVRHQLVPFDPARSSSSGSRPTHEHKEKLLW